MNQKEYKNNLISSYDISYEGILLYPHHKYFDVTKFIMNFVKQAIDGQHSAESYKAYFDKHVQELPTEFKEIFAKNYESFIKRYDYTNKAAKKMEKYKNNFWDKLPGFTSQKERIINTMNFVNDEKLSSKETTISRYGGTFHMKLSGKSENIGDILGYHDKIFNLIVTPEGATQDTIHHEHFHYLKAMGLFKEQNPQYDSLKNEIIAQISSINERSDDIIRSLVTYYIPKYWSTKDIYCFIDLSGQSVDQGITFKNKKREDIENEDIKSKIIKMINNMSFYMAIIRRLKEILVPTYYSDYEQIVYLLAITPLSQWGNLLGYYSRISRFQNQKQEIIEKMQNELNHTLNHNHL